MTNLFQDAHQVLAQLAAGPIPPPITTVDAAEQSNLREALDLLLHLGYLSRDAASDRVLPESRDPAVTENRLALLALAARLERVFQLPCRLAPGAVFVGGEVAPAAFGVAAPDGPTVGLGGRGSSFRAAFEGCLGEGVEYLGFIDWGDAPAFEARARDLVPRSGAAEAAGSATVGPAGAERDLLWMLNGIGLAAGDLNRPLRWLTACRLGAAGQAAAEIAVPADLCLRRAPETGGLPPRKAESNGCAAGPTLEAAQYHALLELVERDSLALWWFGGRSAGALDLGAVAWSELDRFMALLRGGVARRSWFLDLTGDLAIPAVAALSCGDDGGGVTLGFAADLDTLAAARSAALELCQMELAQDLVHLKREQRGPDALNAMDRQHLDRMARLRVDAFPQLLPDPDRAGRQPGPPAGARLDRAIESLHRAGFEAYWIDLTRPEIGIPAVRVLVPGLQSAKPGWITARLMRVATQFGRPRAEVEEYPPLV